MPIIKARSKTRKRKDKRFGKLLTTNVEAFLGKIAAARKALGFEADGNDFIPLRKEIEE